jgi:hypothetical protein
MVNCQLCLPSLPFSDAKKEFKFREPHCFTKKKEQVLNCVEARHILFSLLFCGKKETISKNCQINSPHMEVQK